MIHVVYDVINGVAGNSGIKFLMGEKIYFIDNKPKIFLRLLCNV